MMKLQRVGTGPVLTPREDVSWEKDAVLNCAAWFEDGKFHLFYRAVAHNPGDWNRSCIGHAYSVDGVHFQRKPEPVIRSNECPEESKGVEDPRITLIEGTYHMLYTAYDGSHTAISRATSNDLKHWVRHGVCFSHDVLGDNKDAALLPARVNGEYCLIHRPGGLDHAPDQPTDMWMSFSYDLVNWHGHTRFMPTRRGIVDWEYYKNGLGGTPHWTPKGWLTVYHAVDANRVYRLGLALLDLDDPTRVIKQTDEPILEPAASWEVEGDVNNVVFSCGSVLLENDDLWVYYGGADKVIGLARGNVSEFLN